MRFVVMILLFTQTSFAIVNGERTAQTQEDSRSVVGLKIKMEYQTQDPFTGEIDRQIVESPCTAVLIAEDAFLTAAHCLATSVAAIVVFSPKIDDLSKVDLSLVRRVDTFDFHPMYQDPHSASFDPREPMNDLAIGHFQGGLPAGFQPAKLAMASDLNIQKQLSLFGYGRTDFKIANSGTLRTRLQNFTALKLKRKVIELDQTNGGICNGDSGGPSFLQTHEGKKVFGINSTVDNNLNPMVDPCHGKGTLMNVTFYTEWIQQTLLSLRLRAAGINTIIDTME